MVAINYKFLQELKKTGAQKILTNEPLSSHTSFRIGGPAKFWVEPGDVESLKKVIRLFKEEDIIWHILGGGSNVLAPDKGFNGAIIKLSGGLASIKIQGKQIIAGSGALLNRIAKLAHNNSLSGLEFASGIPGTLGGALVGNSGTGEKQIGDIVISISMLLPNGDIVETSVEDLYFTYRFSSLKDKGIILSAKLLLNHSEPEVISETIERIKERRSSNQPLSYPSAGCIFRNPQFEKAGRLIDRAGIKNWSEGNAHVSDRHANFIINRGNATAQDVLKLIDRIKKRVSEKFGIRLSLEIEILSEK